MSESREEVGCPPWLAELWRLAGQGPDEDPLEHLDELQECVARLRRHLAERERMLEAFRKRLGRVDQPGDAA
jgi:hypothetical protein